MLFRYRMILIVSVGLLMGCSSGSDRTVEGTAEARTPSPAPVPAKKLSEMDVKSAMQRAGLEMTPLDKTYVVPSDYQKFPAEPRSMASIRVSDGQGNSTSMTLVQFDSADQAARIRGVNGFQVHNWFFLGTVSNYFRDKIVSAAG